MGHLSGHLPGGGHVLKAVGLPDVEVGENGTTMLIFEWTLITVEQDIRSTDTLSKAMQTEATSDVTGC